MRSTFSLALGATLLVATSATAQQRWGTPLAGKAEFSLTWDRPSFEDGDSETFDGIWVVGARFRASEKYNVVLAVPQFQGEGSFVGNPYIGLETVGDGRRPEFSLGFRPSYAGNTAASFLGFLTDYDRAEQAIPNAMSLRAAVEQRPWDDGAGAFVAVKVGGTLIRSTVEGAVEPNDFFVDYGFRFGRDLENASIGLGFTGRWLLTAEGAGFAEASIHNFSIDGTFGAGQARPMLGVRFPIDEEIRDFMKYVLVVGVTVGLE